MFHNSSFKFAFEVLKALTMKCVILWVIQPAGGVSQTFPCNKRLHFQGRIVAHEKGKRGRRTAVLVFCLA
jgi:hypothetical protein